MSAPTFGCARIFWNSSGVSGPGLGKNVLGHRELADVVQQRRGLHALNLVLLHAERARDRRRIELHAPDVRLRGLVLGVDGQRQRFDRRKVQVRHLAHVTLLVVYSTEIDLVGAVGQVERRNRQHGEPVGVSEHHPDGEGRNERADEIARRTPEEVLVPDLEDRLPGRQRNRRGDRKGIDDEVGRRGADQRLRDVRPVERAGHAAEQCVDPSGRLHRQDQARHAEQGAVRGIPFLDAERALAVGARRRHHHRLVRPEEQQRGEVDRVRHRHGRAVARDGQVHLEDRGDRREREQQQEQPRRRQRLHGKAHDEQARTEQDDCADIQPRRERQASHRKDSQGALLVMFFVVFFPCRAAAGVPDDRAVSPIPPCLPEPPSEQPRRPPRSRSSRSPPSRS